MPKITDQNKIKRLLLRCPGISNREAATLCGCSEGTVRNVRSEIEQAIKPPLSENELIQIKEILSDALSLKANAGGRIKTEIRKVLEMI